MRIKLFATIFGITIWFTVVYSQLTPYYPDTNWQTKNPEELKINKQLLDSAVSFAKGNETKVDKDLRIANLKAFSREPGYEIIGPMKDRGGPAGVVVKDGYIVAQWGDVNRVDMTYSVAKSFLSTIAGLAIDDGLIKNVNDKVSEYVWDETFESQHNSEITWDNLLTQSSDWSGTQFGVSDWADRPSKEGGIDEWKYRELHEPGTFFRYNDVRVNVLAYSLLQVWRKPLPVVLKNKIMDPIGASTTWRWYGYKNSFVNVDGIMMQSVSGGGHHGGGIFISAMDQARFGLLFLREGRWKNQQLISKEWINAARRSSIPNKDYGYMWWINASQNWKRVSPKVYYAAGFGGNYIVIDDEHDLVIVTRWIDGSKMGKLVELIIKSIENK